MVYSSIKGNKMPKKFVTLSSVTFNTWSERPDLFAMVIDGGMLETVESKRTQLRYT